MEPLMELLIDGIFMLIVPALGLAMLWGIGTIGERRHLGRLRRMEAELLTVPVTDLKALPPGIDGTDGRLVCGSAVLAADHFRNFGARLRNLIGGEVRIYRCLMERARREALCRMMREARPLGAVAVINVRLETSNLNGIGKRRNHNPIVEVVAYGTAIMGHRSGDTAAQ